MLSGVEVAGVVLAVLPLVIQGAQVYMKGVDDIKGIVLVHRYDENQQEFCRSFFVEMTLLRCQFEQIINALSGVSEQRKAELLEELSFQSEDWEPEGEIAVALEILYGSSYELFIIVVNNIMRLMGHLIRDKSVKNLPSQKDPTEVYNKLKNFYNDRKTSTSSSTLIERIRFWKAADKRAKNIERLKEWNTTMRLITDQATRLSQLKNISLPPGWQKPLNELRDSARDLYCAMSGCWQCQCGRQHEARLCLQALDSFPRSTTSSTTDFDILVQTSEQGKSVWKEGIVLVRAASLVGTNRNKGIQKICEMLCNIPNEQLCFHFLVETTAGHQRAWQLGHQPKRLKIQQGKSPVQLRALFDDKIPPLQYQRELALKIAIALLGLHEETWLRDGCTKDTISFFHSANALDYRRPFISTYFENVAKLKALPTSACPGNPRILALGILLFEIHKWKPIELFRTKADLSNDGQVNDFTDFTAVTREAEQLKDCSLDYKEAIQACMRTDSWVRPDDDVSLEDLRVREGLYIEVIEPLKRELNNLFRTKL